MKLTAEFFSSIVQAVKGDQVSKRRHPRAPVRARLQVIPLKTSKRFPPVELWARDVARGGIGLASPKEFPIGMRFLAPLPGPNGTSLNLLCTVRACTLEAGGMYLVGASYVEVAASAIEASTEDRAEILRIRRAILERTDPPR